MVEGYPDIRVILAGESEPCRDPASTYPGAVRCTCREGTREASGVEAWMSASREGLLIHAVVGTFGDWGRRWRKRVGLAAMAALSCAAWA